MLKEAPTENLFWVCDGKVLKNLQELKVALENMNDDSYRYHVNQEKNDFANWIKDIFGEEKLAQQLRKARSRQEATKQVQKVLAGKK